MPDKPQLERIRTAILRDGKGFRKAIAGKAFADLFPDGVQGERNKVLPAEFKAAVAREPLLANKQFYVGAELPAKLVADAKLMDLLMDHYQAMRPLNSWLSTALKGR
jgi:hypothetical protein